MALYREQRCEEHNVGKENGLISELVYNERQPAVAQLLLPLLQQLGKQSRWLLWLTPQQKLSKQWLQQSGLPVDKMVQLSQISPVNTVEAMEKRCKRGTTAWYSAGCPS